MTPNHFVAAPFRRVLSEVGEGRHRVRRTRRLSAFRISLPSRESQDLLIDGALDDLLRDCTLLDRGFITSHGARTGEEIYGRTRFPEGASSTSSPWAFNGNIFFLSKAGGTYVVEAESEFKVVLVSLREKRPREILRKVIFLLRSPTAMPRPSRFTTVSLRGSLLRS